MNDLQIFTNSVFGNIRVVDKNGNPWFIAKDIAFILGYSATEKMTRRLKVKDKSKLDKPPISGCSFNSLSPEPLTIISEAGLYVSIFGSKKPDAEKFQDWVYNDVLPQIRKTGTYGKAEQMSLIDEMILTPQLGIKLFKALEKEREEKQKAIATKAEIGSRREATAMNTASQAAKKVKKLTEELGMNSEWATILKVSIALKKSEKSFNWRELKKASLEIGKPPKRIEDPRFGYANSYCAEAWYMAYDVILKELF